jgi:predicted DNA-binding protein
MAGGHPDNKTTIACWVDKKFVDRLDKLADKAGLTRAKLAENLLEIGVDQLEVLKTLGIMSTALVFRDLKENLKKWSEQQSKNMGAKLNAGC